MYDKGRKPLWDVVTPWHQSLDLPGTTQLIHLKRLLLSRPYVTRIPDQSVTLNTVRIGAASVNVSWFNPRTGEVTPVGKQPNTSPMEFEPPTRVPGEDWVLALDDSVNNYLPPGTSKR